MAVTFTPISNAGNALNDTIGWQSLLQFVTRPSTSFANRAQLEGDWYLNYALWIENGGSYGESPTQWKLPALYVNIPTGGLTALPATFPFVLVMNSGGGSNANNNYIADGSITFTNAGAGNINIQILFYHFTHADFLDYQNGTSWNNARKYLRNSNNSPSDLTNTSPAAYNFQKIARLRLYVKQANSGDVSVFQQNFSRQPRWYNSDGLGAPIATLTNPQFTIFQGVTPQTTLSTIYNTNVVFSTVGNYTTPHFILIRTDTTNQTQTQLLSQQTSYAQIPSLAPPVFVGIPVTNSIFIAPTSHVLNTHNATITASQLVPNARYRIIAVVQSAGKMYSFISNEYLTDSNVAIIPPNFADFMSDVESEKLTAWLDTTAEERVRSRIVWDGNPYNSNKTTPFATALQRIAVRIYWLETVGTNVFTHILEQYIRTRDPINAFTPADKLNVVTTGQTVDMYYTWVNQADPNALNLLTLLNGVALPLPLSDQNWNGRTIFIEWTLELQQPGFVDVIVRKHKSVILDYVNTFTFDFFDPINPVADFICDDQLETKIEITGGDINFATYLFKTSPFSVANREEEETFPSFLPALDTPKFLNVPPVDPYFITNVATAYVDNLQVTNNIPTKVGIISKIFDPCPNTASQVIARMNVVNPGDPVTPARAILITDLITTLKACDVWCKVIRFYVFAAHNVDAAQVEWRCPNVIPYAPFLFSSFGTITFTMDIGISGTATNFCTYGYNMPSAPCVNIGLGIKENYENPAHDGINFGIWIVNNGGDTPTKLQASSVGGLVNMAGITPSNVHLFSSALQAIPPNVTGLKMVQRIRSNPNVLEYYHNGAQTLFPDIFVSGIAGQGISCMGDVFFFPALNSNSQQAAAIVTWDLTPAQQICLHSALNTYLTAL